MADLKTDEIVTDDVIEVTAVEGAAIWHCGPMTSLWSHQYVGQSSCCNRKRQLGVPGLLRPPRRLAIHRLA